jgi:hypothetical protein
MAMQQQLSTGLRLIGRHLAVDVVEEHVQVERQEPERHHRRDGPREFGHNVRMGQRFHRPRLPGLHS